MEPLKRRQPTRDEKQAAVYLMLTRRDGSPIIEREVAKKMTPREIIEEFDRRVNWHHEYEHALGGGMHPTMLTPLPPEEHKKIPSSTRVAKARRIEKDQERFRQRLLAKDQGERLPPPKRSKRGHAPMAGGRGSKFKRTMSGKVVLR